MNKGGREVGRGTAISKADSSHLYEAYQHDTPGLSQGQLEEPTLSKNLWVHDEKVKACTKCKKPFTFFYRKHHCRICGNVYCNNCTSVKPMSNKNKQLESVRMCEVCEAQLENYKQSLKNKNNLFDVSNHRVSFRNTNDFEEEEAPLNGKSGSHDSEDETPAITMEERKRQEEQEAQNMQRLDELNQAEQEIPVQEYLSKNAHEDDHGDRTFSLMHSVLSHNRKEKEDNVKRCLKEYSDHHIRQIVADVMKTYEIDTAKWGQKLLGFVQKAVDEVRPSSRHLNDSMNFNSFIKIKIINWHDNSKSAYINGVVLNKNLADKRMDGLINDPSILLLKDSVGTTKGEGPNLTEIQSIVDQENSWIEIIKSKLTQVKPNIIIVEKDVGYKILDVLRESRITVITNLSSHKMKRIQRYTQTIISPSYNVIDKSFKLGKCKQFRVEAPFQGSQMQRMQLEMMDPSRKQDMSLFSNEKSLIYFEGTNPALGCTILLSGNKATELKELRDVKNAFREMLKLARNVILERAFLLQLNCRINPLTYDAQGALVASQSPFLITKSVANRQILVMNKVTMKRGVQSEKTPANNTTTNLNVSALGLPKFDIEESQIVTAAKNHETSSVSHNVLKMARAAVPDKEKVNENYVKTKIDSMCGCPEKEKFKYYLKEQDESIGKFLFRMSRFFTQQCEQCKETMYKHFIQYYHKDGCLELHVDAVTQTPQTATRWKTGEPADKKSKDIVMRGWCRLCQRQVTPDAVMTNTFYEYSKARFLEQFFYNGEHLENIDAYCQHKSLREINRVFQMPGNYVITFTFIPLEVYQIEMIQPKKQDTRLVYRQAIEQRRAKMFEFCSQAYAEVKGKMHLLVDFIEREQRSYLPKDRQRKMEALGTLSHVDAFLQALQKIKESLSPNEEAQPTIHTFESELTFVVSQMQKPVMDVGTIFEAMFLERKMLLTFLTFSRLLTESSKVACLVLALLRLRLQVLYKSEHALSESLDPTKPGTDLLQTTLQKSLSTAASSTIEALSSTGRKNSQNLENEQPPEKQYQFNFLEDLITMSELNKQIQQNATTPQLQQNPSLGASGKLSTGVLNNTDNVGAVKKYVEGSAKGLLGKFMYLLSADVAQSLLADRQAPDKPLLKVEEEEAKGDSNLRGSISQAYEAKTLLSNTAQNLTAMNILPPEPTQESHAQWPRQLGCGHVTMPLGTDNHYIPINDNNIGSIISFVLASNIYKEAMVKQNYMDMASKVKGPSKHQRPFAGATDTSQDNLRGSILGSANLGPPSSNLGSQQSVDEAVKLAGKDDVFNYELSPHQIETELLCGERLNFAFKFNTHQKDFHLTIEKNGAIQTQHTGQTPMQFQTFRAKRVGKKEATDATKPKRKEEFIKNDLQERVCGMLSKEYMDYKNAFVASHMGTLQEILQIFNIVYFGFPAQKTSSAKLQDEAHNTIDQTPSYVLMQEQDSSLLQQSSLRDSQVQMMKSPQIATASPLAGQAQNPNEFCGVEVPNEKTFKAFETLKDELAVPKISYKVKVYFPKKFEALRRFYCGSQYEFIESLIQTQEWTSVSGGKTKSKFYRSFDDKYVFKEIKKSEFKMFLEFAPQYFDYLCKSFFHNYPCALCKILGAFKIKIMTAKENGTKITKKHIYITENLNYGIKPEDEGHIVRYDLKGSTLNRFVKAQVSGVEGNKMVLHDNNFQLAFMGRPLPIRYTINRILHICINNDTLCLSKANIVDYSLLTIIDTKRKKVRFGIIDYVQQYTLDKIFEGKFKKIINRGEVPTIVDPDKYKLRFKKAMKRYFIGMVVQDDKQPHEGRLELMDEHDSEEETELNETRLNETFTTVPRILIEEEAPKQEEAEVYMASPSLP